MLLHDWQPQPELPDWYNAFRAAAREVYVDNELPGYGDEAWHYGDPRKFALESLGLDTQADARSAHAEELLKLAYMHEGATVSSWQGGRLELRDVNPDDAQAGIRLVQLSDLAREGQADGLQRYWGEDAPQLYGSKLPGAHYALAPDPLVLLIPEQTEASGPLFLNINAARAGAVAAPQLLIVAGRQSKAELSLTVTTESAEERQLILASTRCFLAAGAQFRLSRLQHLGERTDSLTMESASIARDALYTSVNLVFGGRNVRLEATANLTEPGSTAHLYSGCVTRGRQRYDFLTHQNHLAPNANSNLLYKNALLDRSRVSYQGTITVHPGAQKTDAYQKNRSLVLSPQARSDSSPQLEIKADDVKCSHGSTTSNVSAAELFYLRSRGISEADARQLLVDGFLGEIAAQLPSPALREYVSARVLERF